MKRAIGLLVVVLVAAWGCGDFNTSPTCGALGQPCCSAGGCTDGLRCTLGGVCASNSVVACGDGTCSGSTETCGSCPRDCGACPVFDAGTLSDLGMPIDTSAPTDQGIPPAPCVGPRQMCGKLCLDTSSDNSNCGSCGSVCPAGRTCTGGTCACTMGATLCGTRCAYTLSDSTNCGGCGRACATGQNCSGGLCSSTCTEPRRMCGPFCTDTLSDNSNCGSCGRACAPGTTCIAGNCACPTGLTFCGASCVNTLTNASNCGGCSRACASGQTCVEGTCRTPVDCAPQTTCGGCSALAGCGWCGATRACVRINSACTGPLTGSCPGQWACNPSDCDPRVPLPCANDSDCSPTGVPTASRCVTNPGNGPGNTCAKVCRTNADCASGCCYPFGSGSVSVNVCAHLALCASRSGCSIPAGSNSSCFLGGTPSCCNYNDAPRIPFTQCDYSYSTPICARLCTRSSDCASGCCALDPGVDLYRCVAVGNGVCAPG